MKKLVPLISLLVFGATFGCDEVDEAFDCQAICNEYQDCYDASLNVDTCIDDCFDAIDADASLDTDADQCRDCIENAACTDISSECPTCETVFDAFTG